MSTRQIDQISEAIGALRAEVQSVRLDTQSIRTDVKAVSDKVDTNTELCAGMSEKISSAHKRLDEIEPTVDDLNNFKNKQLGIVGCVSFIVTLIGAGIAKVIFHAF